MKGQLAAGRAAVTSAQRVGEEQRHLRNVLSKAADEAQGQGSSPTNTSLSQKTLLYGVLSSCSEENGSIGKEIKEWEARVRKISLRIQTGQAWEGHSRPSITRKEPLWG